MQDPYEPASDFLKGVIAEEVPLSGSIWGEVNLQHLLAMMQDANRSNRDWATFLLAQEAVDGPAVRQALLTAAADADDVVRGEAVLGLAARDAALALPFVQRALTGGYVTVPMLEAAQLCAHPSLIADLRVWAEPSDEPLVDHCAAAALAACERAATNDQ